MTVKQLLFKGFANAIAIIRTGKHTDSEGNKVTITEDHLDEMIANYADDSIPYVIGHPEKNAPAYGWSSGLFKKDGVLFTNSADVNPDFKAGVESGAYRNRSVAINKNEFGDYYLRHVGFLGAAAPAIKGLANMSFADDGQFIELTFSDAQVESAVRSTGWAMSGIYRWVRKMKNALIESVGADKADEQFPEYELDQLQEASRQSRDVSTKRPSHFSLEEISKLNRGYKMPPVKQPKSSDDDKPVTFSEEDVQKREQQAEARAEKKFAHKRSCREFAEQLEKDGKILPAQIDETVEFLESQSEGITFEFSEGEGDDKKTVQRSQFEMAKLVFSGYPDKYSHLKKEIVNDGNAPDAGNAKSFSAPAGMAVDPEGLEVHNKALQFQAKNPNTTYIDAVVAVS